MKIIFVGGLGGHHGRDLTWPEELAIKLCMARCPRDAEIILHTAKTSWSGPAYKRLQSLAESCCILFSKIEHEYEAYAKLPLCEIAHGAHMSDWLRIQLLCDADCETLYIDTDCYIFDASVFADLASFSEGTKLVAISQRPGSYRLQNGMLYVPHGGHAIIEQHKLCYLEATAESFEAWDALSCGKLGKIALRNKKLLHRLCPSYACVPLPGNLPQYKAIPDGGKLLQTYITAKYKTKAFESGCIFHEKLKELESSGNEMLATLIATCLQTGNTDFQSLKCDYTKLSEQCTVTKSAKNIADEIRAERPTLLLASLLLKLDGKYVPWQVLGALQKLEAGSMDFSKSIADGTKLKCKSRGCTRRWLSSLQKALDESALRQANADSWSREAKLWFAESHNGFGYRQYARGNSPYLWSGTSCYKKGKYIADGKYSPEIVSQQIGIMPILQSLGK